MGRFAEWWNRPIKAKDRSRAATIGLFGGFWVGIIVKLVVSSEGSIMDLLAFGGGAAVVGMILGIAFPKVVTVVLFPFSVFGFGD